MSGLIGLALAAAIALLVAPVWACGRATASLAVRVPPAVGVAPTAVRRHVMAGLERTGYGLCDDPTGEPAEATIVVSAGSGARVHLTVRHRGGLRLDREVALASLPEDARSLAVAIEVEELIATVLNPARRARVEQAAASPEKASSPGGRPSPTDRRLRSSSPRSAAPKGRPEPGPPATSPASPGPAGPGPALAALAEARLFGAVGGALFPGAQIGVLASFGPVAVRLAVGGAGLVPATADNGAVTGLGLHLAPGVEVVLASGAHWHLAGLIVLEGQHLTFSGDPRGGSRGRTASGWTLVPQVGGVAVGRLLPGLQLTVSVVGGAPLLPLRATDTGDGVVAVSGLAGSVAVGSRVAF